MTPAKNTHPYHYSQDKNILQKIIDFAVPILLFWVYFNYYNFGKITPSEMIKTSGLLTITLLSLTLIIGPICKLFPSWDFLKTHRKFWGILSFLAALIHVAIIFMNYYKFDLLKFVDFANPKYPGILAGILSLAILLLVTLTSNKLALKSLSPNIWKIIQTTSYLALILAVAHFYIVESVDGVLTIKRLAGQLTFGFATLTVLLRFLVLFIPRR